MIKKLFENILPPFLVSLYRFFKRYLKILIKKKFKNSFLYNNQKLNVYYTEKMACDLEIWGKNNAWIDIQHLLHDKKSKNILDIACGTGKVIAMLEKVNNSNFYGCDISEYLIKKAINRTQIDLSLDKFTVCDARNLPYKPNHFDYSYSVGSLEHFTEEGIDLFLKEAKRVTKYFSYHMVPISKLKKNEGWIECEYSLQTYFNNTEEWWRNKCDKTFKEVTIIKSTWSSEMSDGIWLILK
jgi:ubiquinone/menaquinone biosynthesis C-methylase UbiE